MKPCQFVLSLNRDSNYPLSAWLCQELLELLVSLKKSCPFGQSLYSESSPPELLVNVFEVTSLLTPSLMAIAFTVVVALRENASL